jgi:hypothetical protein
VIHSALLGCLSALVIFAHGAYAQGPVEITNGVGLDVKLSKTNESLWQLDFVLTNATHQTIHVARASLPWEARTSLILVLVETRGGGISLRESLILESPIPGDVDVGSFRSLSGSVNLNHRFLTLGDVTRRSDVIVFWTYQLRTVDNVAMTRIGGWFLISKASK